MLSGVVVLLSQGVGSSLDHAARDEREGKLFWTVGPQFTTRANQCRQFRENRVRYKLRVEDARRDDASP